MASRGAVPWPGGYPFVGVLPELLRDPLRTLLDGAARGGEVVYLGLGPRPVYLVNHPALIRQILQDNYHKYSKTPGVNKIKPLFGEGLLPDPTHPSISQQKW